MNLGVGLGVAVREFGTASGPVDYALFVGGTLCGVVEAKPEGTTLSGFADQAARYMGGVPEYLVRREGQVRFEYVASGTEILFRGHADPAPRSRRVFFFHRPETLRRVAHRPDDDPRASAIDAAPADGTAARLPDRRGDKARSRASDRSCRFRSHDQTPAERGERRFELFEADGVVAVEDMGHLLRGPSEPL